MRRPLLILVAATFAVASTVLPAAAAGVTWLSPGAGAVVTGPVDVAVRIDRQVGETVDGVTVRLSHDGSAVAPGTRSRDLRCAEADGCNSFGQRADRWGLVQLSADGGELASGPVCNGQYVLQARPAGAEGWAGTPVVLSDRTVAAVTGLTADGEPRQALLSWTAPDGADDVRLRVERRAEGTSVWDAVAVLPATASAFTDDGVAAGTYDYRVVSTRGDGFVGGRPVAACTDDDADHTATSATRQVVVAPGPTPAPPSSGSSTTDGQPRSGSTSGSDLGDGPSGTDEGPGGGAEDPADPDGDGADDADDGADADEGTAGARTTGPRTRIAPPPPARRGSSEVRAPQIARPQAGGETYFGEGDAFSEELDYGDAGPLAVEDPGEESAFGRLVPGATRTITELQLDRREVLLPIAIGLLLLASGMHVRRWMGSA